MIACGQTVGEENVNQYKLYLDLINEEVQELKDSTMPADDLDALVDILVVTMGAINSMGADGEGAWREVMSTNFAKIDKVTGKVRKREDGKVLKPEGWTAPDLMKYVNRNHQ